MKIEMISSDRVPVTPGSGFSAAIAVSAVTRTLYISGQVPVSAGRAPPGTFKEQAELAWANVEAQLLAAGMTFDNLVKTTVILSDRKYGPEFRAVRKAVLGDRAPASTLIIAGLFDAAWMVEIEGVAVA